MRAHARAQLAALPEALRALEGAPSYPVQVDPALKTLAERTDRASLG
jgi:nicotinate phosphoribosyltransferase